MVGSRNSKRVASELQ